MWVDTRVTALIHCKPLSIVDLNLMPLELSNKFQIPDSEIEITAIRAQGPGGQNVNKVSSAIHLRFDIHQSSLPPAAKERLLEFSDQRISKDGVIIIKAQQFRTQLKNREDALQRLRELIDSALIEQKKRKPTKPSKAAKKRRLDAKTRRGQTKQLRKPVSGDG